MVGWHHRHNGHGFEWTLGVGDGQGGLACCGSWGHKESDTIEWLDWTELRGKKKVSPFNLLLLNPSLVAQAVSNPPAVQNWVWSQWGRYPGEGNSNPCLENSMDRGAWQATVHGVAKCQTGMSNQNTNPNDFKSYTAHNPIKSGVNCQFVFLLFWVTCFIFSAYFQLVFLLYWFIRVY